MNPGRFVLWSALLLAVLVAGAVLLWPGRSPRPAPLPAESASTAQPSRPSTATPSAPKNSGLPGSLPRIAGTQDTNLVEVFSSWGAFRPLKLPADSALRFKKEQEAKVQDIIGKDIADGINQEARVKEARLRTQATHLATGLSPEEVTRILGPPDVVKQVIMQGEMLEMPRTNSLQDVPDGVQSIASYWPRVGVPFDGRNGQGYMVLHLLFDAHHHLERWQWEAPYYVSGGSLTQTLREEKYWNGQHTLSGPPPN